MLRNATDVCLCLCCVCVCIFCFLSSPTTSPAFFSSEDNKDRIYLGWINYLCTYCWSKINCKLPTDIKRKILIRVLSRESRCIQEDGKINLRMFMSYFQRIERGLSFTVWHKASDNYQQIEKTLFLVSW